MEKNIINIIMDFMEEVNEVVEKTGEEKKEYVLECVRTKYGDEVYERYEPLINLLINFVVDVSKGKINIKKKLKRIKNNCIG